MIVNIPYEKSRSHNQISNRSEVKLPSQILGSKPLESLYFTPNIKHKRRPDVIQWANEKLKMFYVEPGTCLKSLSQIRESSRKMRVEGRLNTVKVLGVLLHYVELASLRVGVPKENGEFISFSMKWFAKQIGLRTDLDDRIDKERINNGKRPANRGVKTVWRIINELKKAGYITVHERYFKEQDNNGEEHYSGRAAIRRLTPKLFNDLGISAVKLEQKRKEAAKRLKAKYRKYQEQIESELNILDNLKSKLGMMFKSVVSTSKWKYKSEDAKAQREKARVMKCGELLRLPENKGFSPKELYTKYPHLEYSKWHNLK